MLCEIDFLLKICN